jgi:Mce-associated membrane protein
VQVWLLENSLGGFLATMTQFATVFALVSWRQEAGAAGARAEALDAAKRYALDLTSYDYRTMDRNFGLVAQNASPGFAAQYKQVSDQLSGIIGKYQGVSVGTVLDAGVAGGDGSRVDVLLFIDQRITNTQTKDPRTDRSRMRMSLVSQDGTWKIDSLTLV